MGQNISFDSYILSPSPVLFCQSSFKGIVVSFFLVSSAIKQHEEQDTRSDVEGKSVQYYLHTKQVVSLSTVVVCQLGNSEIFPRFHV